MAAWPCGALQSMIDTHRLIICFARYTLERLARGSLRDRHAFVLIGRNQPSTQTCTEFHSMWIQRGISRTGDDGSRCLVRFSFVVNLRVTWPNERALPSIAVGHWRLCMRKIVSRLPVDKTLFFLYSLRRKICSKLLYRGMWYSSKWMRTRFTRFTAVFRSW